MFRSFFFLASILMTSVVWGQPDRAHAEASLQITAFEGVATHPETGQILYHEAHTVTLQAGQPLKAETLYTSPRGDKWAELTTDYATSDDRYTYRFQDFRTGKIHGVKLDTQGRPVMFSRSHADEPLEEERYEPGKTSVVSVAGQVFHWMLREQILSGRLPPGADLEFRLLLPPLSDYFTFQVQALGEEQGKVRLTVDLDNFFLRWLAKAGMGVVYERHTGRLLEYVGPSSMTDDGGDLIDNVKIVYRYTG